MKKRIGLYTWNILFVPKDNIIGDDGQTKTNDFQILIRNDLPLETTRIAITHEVVHALLSTQGRVYQRKFDIEEVCEFIAWKLPEINDVVDNIMAEVEKNESSND